MHTQFLETVAERLGPFCTRREAEEAMSGLLKARTLANLDSKGIGPGGALHAKKVLYQKHNFIAWLQGYLQQHSSMRFARKEGETVISPFMVAFVSRAYAACLSFMVGVMPPMPMLGRSLL